MASFYESIAATALGLLTKFGQSITLARTTGGSVDPITGAIVAGTDASVTTTGILLAYPDDMIDGTRILDSDRILLVSNEQIPLPTDKPIINGEEWSVVSINTLNPAGTALRYRIQVRR